jgi:hypothetical protein
MDRVVIVAHTRIQAERFMHINYLRHSDVIYVDEPRRLYGLKDYVCIFLEGYQFGRESHRIEEEVEMQRRLGRVVFLKMQDDSFLGIQIMEHIEGGTEISEPLWKLIDLKMRRLREALRKGAG